MKRQMTIALCAALAAAAGCSHDGGSNPPVSDLSVTRDQAVQPADMTDLTAVDPLAGNPQVTKLATGMAFKYAQSPLWVPSLNALLFSDIQSQMIYQLALPTTLTQFRSTSNGSNGLALDPQGNLVVCEATTRQITRRPLTGASPTYTTVVSMSDSGALNGPNDVAVRHDGTIYFTDPGATAPAFDGLYRIAPSATTAIMLDKTMRFPDGLALSPLENSLYVAAASDGKVYKFPVNTDGSLGARSDFAQGLWNCGGVAVDDAGNVYVATPSGVRVFKEDGTPRGALPVPELTTNLSFGGADRKTLFISGPTSVYSVSLQVPGRP